MISKSFNLGFYCAPSAQNNVLWKRSSWRNKVLRVIGIILALVLGTCKSVRSSHISTLIYIWYRGFDCSWSLGSVWESAGIWILEVFSSLVLILFSAIFSSFASLFSLWNKPWKSQFALSAWILFLFFIL